MEVWCVYLLTLLPWLYIRAMPYDERLWVYLYFIVYTALYYISNLNSENSCFDETSCLMLVYDILLLWSYICPIWLMQLECIWQSPRKQDTPSKHPLVTLAHQPQYQSVILNHHQSLNQNQQTTLVACTHESGQSSQLPDISQGHESPTLSQNMASFEPLGGSHTLGRLNMMVSFFFYC